MNTISINNTSSKRISSRMTIASVVAIALSVLSFYARYQQVDTRSAVSTFLLIMGAALLLVGTIVFIVRPKQVEATERKSFSINWGKVKVFGFMALILGYVVFSHIMGGLVTLN